MKNLKPARRARLARALRPEFAASAFGQTGLIPSLPQDEFEENSYRDIYPIHKSLKHK